VSEALARGTKHYSIEGKFLETPKEIMEALIKDGRIEFEPVIK
jgi:hypothetical protein